MDIDAHSLVLAGETDMLALKSAMLASADAVDLTDHTSHHFAHGVYGRELRIPAGVAVMGKVHRHSTLNVLASGELAVTTPDGPQVLKAPAIFVSPAGTRKLGFAITDCVFLNVHASQETDLDKLESELIVPDELTIAGEAKCLG
jgi:hypothetical protein